MRLFTQRNSAPPDRYSFAIQNQVRQRILHTFGQIAADRDFDFDGFLQEVAVLICAKKGKLHEYSIQAAMADANPVINHFLSVGDKEALDFIELMFQTRTVQRAGLCEPLVPAFNEIFEEEGIGFELTPQRAIDTGKPGLLFGHHTGSNAFRIEPPQILRKGERTTHEHAVKPALEVLGDSRFSTANTELLHAFEKVKEGHYPEAITACCCAFESVMKTICDLKKWTYDQKDPCSKLVEVCRSNGLFPPFYTESLKGVGTVRNTIGSAHGKGQAPTIKATSDHAEYMIAVTCSHITFLIRQSRI